VQNTKSKKMNASTLLVVLASVFVGVLQDSRPVDVYFGTAKSNTQSPAGVYQAGFAQETAKLSDSRLIFELAGAGWVTQHPDQKVLYVTGNVDGKPSVVALEKGPERASLINSQRIGDGGACFLTTDQTGAMLISAQYGGGSVAVFPIDDDHSIGERSQLLEHTGGSRAVKNRQDSPHPHYVSISPDNRFAFVPDLGSDQLVVYKINVEQKKLEPHGEIDVVKGGGPRHMKFHPNGEWAFVLNELELSVSVFAYDSESGGMKLMTTVPALTEEEKSRNDFNSASEIQVDPDGSFVFTANRGHDSISVFKFNASPTASRSLVRISNEPVRGSWPRNFNVTPDGKYLLVAGKDSNSVTVFSVDREQGVLRYLQHQSKFVPAPICVSVESN
jgi:6-phosphogluconolactonase